MTILEAAPGDVIAVWTGSGFTQDMIRVEEALRGLPAVANHVVGVTHQDKLGRWIGLEGRPGGFGLVDVTPYLSDGRSRSNHGQPRTPQQNALILAGAAKLTGAPYDWAGGIAADGAMALHLDELAAGLDKLWAWPSDHNLLPGHIVCSSAWAWVYEYAGAAHPDLGYERTCDPAGWWAWNDGRQWEHPLPAPPHPAGAP